MADTLAPHLVGESIVALLQARRALLVQGGQLAGVPATADIAHVPVAKLVSPAPPSAGLSLTCFHLTRADQVRPVASATAPGAIGLSLELHYLLACWEGTAADELSLMAWAMLELNRFPVLGAGHLVGAGWSRGESVQLVQGGETPEQLARIWDSFKLKARLSAVYRARTVHIGYGNVGEGLPVVASRLSFADGDVAMEPTS